MPLSCFIVASFRDSGRAWSMPVDNGLVKYGRTCLMYSISSPVFPHLQFELHPVCGKKNTIKVNLLIQNCVSLNLITSLTGNGLHQHIAIRRTSPVALYLHIR